MKIVRILVLVVLAVFFDHVSSEPGWGPISFLGRPKQRETPPPKVNFQQCMMERLNTAEKECSVFIRT
ncbi:hypothetical protein KM043_013121 [Ampulex compressa]|nr:hypothetical protein KM043_013121 [Ampulex compressa]